MVFRKVWSVAIAVGAVMLFCSAFAVAQVASGTLVGTVTDSQGGAVVGATVTAKNVATGIERSVSTNDQGFYEISALSPGTYGVTIEAQNFAKTVKDGVVVAVGTRTTQSISLQPAGATAVVTVTGEAPPIETTNTVIQGNVNNKQLQDLPLSGRAFSNLAILVPGAKPVGAFDPTKARTGTISLSGSSGRDVNVSIDGGDNKDNVVGGALQNYTVEGIQEFVVQTQNFQPDTGRTAGGQVVVVTKSGSNQFHGGAFFFERNDALIARDFFNRTPQVPTGTPQTPLDRQNFGGSFGGPIKKDRAWFFFAIERIRENISISQVPGAVRELQALNVLAQRGQMSSIGVTSVAALSSIPTPYRDIQHQVRVDWKPADKHNLTFRWAGQGNRLDNDQVAPTDDISAGATTTNALRSMLITHNWLISPRAVNTFTFQFNKFINRIDAKDQKFVRPNGQIGIPALFFPSGANIGRDGNVPQSTLQNKFQFKDSYAFNYGRHSMKFGLDFTWTPILGGTFDFLSTPEVDYNEDPSTILAQLGTRPLGLNDPRYVDDVILADGVSRVDQSVKQWSWFAQDSFRMSTRFTVNYGLRWDGDFGFYNLKHGLNQANNRAVQILKAIGHPIARSLPKDDKNNYSPRIGIAWDPSGNGKSVLRLSFGLFYDQIFENVQFFGLQQANTNIYAFAEFPFTSLAGLPLRTGSLPNLRSGDTGRFIDPSIRTPYTQQASFNYQWEFKPGWTFETSYVHILGLKQFMNQELNPRIGPLIGFKPGDPTPKRILRDALINHGEPVLGRIRAASSMNRSRYDGWTIGIRKRYANKFQFDANYTLSYAKVYGSAQFGGDINDFGISFENPFQWFRPIDYGYANQDARHRAVINAIYDLPWGFQVSGLVQAESARPYTIYAGRDLNGDGRTPATDFARIDPDGTFRFDGKGAPLGLSSERGDPYFQTDFRITKFFKIGEHFRIQAFFEAFNLFNTNNFGNAFPSDARFGQNRSVLRHAPQGLFGSSFGAGTTLGVPFSGQFGARFSF